MFKKIKVLEPIAECKVRFLRRASVQRIVGFKMHPNMACQVRRFGAVAIALVLGTLSLSANAIAFRTRWDPLFNVAFNSDTGLNVGWSGAALIELNNGNCLVGPNGSVDVAGCGGASLLSASVNFYDIANANAPITSAAWPLDFSIGSAPTLVSVDLNGLVTGMQLDTPLIGSVTLDGIGYGLALGFGLGSGVVGEWGLPVLTLTTFNDNEQLVQYTSGECESCVPDTQWSRVPEPTSLALTGIGLLLAFALRRGRKT